jgi:FMN phosphatase YigB (HAD superfamily)
MSVKKLFLDDKLLVRSTAHEAALNHLHSGTRDDIEMKPLRKAYHEHFPQYLEDHRSELQGPVMSGIVRKILFQLEAPEKFVSPISDIYSQYSHDRCFEEGAEELLPKFAEREGLHLIANVQNKYSLLPFNLRRYFETITLSSDVGARKPLPLIYQKAMEKASADPDESVFVSSEKLEVMGARGAGMEGIRVADFEEIYQMVLEGY